MKPNLLRIGTLLLIAMLLLTAAQTGGQELPKGKGIDVQKPAAKADPAVVAELIKQLASNNFKIREKASQRLVMLDEVPDALRDAVKHPDPEVAKRAQVAIATITARLEQRAFEALLRDLHKIELDRFVRRMVTEKEFAGEQQWQIIQTIAKAVTKEANKLGGRQFEIAEFDVNKMPRVLYDSKTGDRRLAMNRAVVLSAGPTPRITSVVNALVIIDGDFGGATGITNSLLIVRGNVSRVTGVTNSIILATGHWEGATSCRNSFVQVANHQIRFNSTYDSIFIKTLLKATNENSRVLNIDKGPLQLLKFSPRKPDDQLDWGKEVNNLTVAIAPADRKDHFLIRWRNAGKDDLQIPWARLHSSLPIRYQDDLLDHVFLKGPDGKLAAARKYPPLPAGRPLLLAGSVVLTPGQSFDETIYLWDYLEKPAAGGRYQLSIELDIPQGRRGRDFEVKSWSGKIQSNVLDVTIGK